MGLTGSLGDMLSVKTLFVALLAVLWVVGLLDQLHSWEAGSRYMVLSGLIAAIAMLKGGYSA
jgi:hypothetical protein